MVNAVVKYQKYAEYQDSGVEWLGEIPSHWNVSKIGFHTSKIGSGKTPKGGAEIYKDEGVLFLRSQNIYNDGLKIDASESVFITQAIHDDMSTSKVDSGDILLNITGGSIGRSCLVPSNFQEANVNQHVCIIRVRNPLNKFLAQVIKADLIQSQIRLIQTGGNREGLNFEQISKFIFILPSFDEQQLIIKFLDHETAKIDSLIEKQQKLIELLKEKRQAVISHAVTKGLDPDVTMKDSGVEWLGQVPEHWQITTVRNLIRSNNLQLQDGNHGELHPTANDYVEKGIPFLMANNVRDGNLLMNDVKKIPKSVADKLRIGFANKGDMLLTHKGTVGEVALVPQEIEEEYWMLTPQVTYYRWNSQKFFNQYFYYQFQSNSIQNQLEIIGGKQSTRAYVGLIAQGDLIVAIPPIDEQKHIASSIVEKDRSYQLMIEKANLAIELIQERRTALISSAVTGKIDVRNWQNPQQDLAV